MYATSLNIAPPMPAATGQFHLQSSKDQVEIGAYPIVNVYANLHLKRTRFFVMMYHVNDGLINRPNSFYAPTIRSIHDC